MKIQLPQSTRRFLSKDDIGTREITVEIAVVGEVEFASGDKKIAIAFTGKQKRLVAGAPILRTLVAAWGDDSAGWIGRKAVLYVDPDVSFGGASVGALRLRPVPGQDATAATLRPAPVAVADAATPF